MNIEVSENKKSDSSGKMISIIPFFEGEENRNLNDDFRKSLSEIGFNAKLRDTRIVSFPDSKEVLCGVGLGKREKYSLDLYRKALSSAIKDIQKKKIFSC
jgi:Cytosol aminopeptidase family, N-terminal domain.